MPIRGVGFRSWFARMAALAALSVSIVGMTGCKGDGDAALAHATLDASGGESALPDGVGGSGGSIVLSIDDPSAQPGADRIEILNGGRVDTSFDSPDMPSPDFGSNGLVVDGDVLVGTRISKESFDGAAGSVYVALFFGPVLHVSNGNGSVLDDAVVTGLHVLETGRLVLPNSNLLPGTGNSTLVVKVEGDIVNDGVIEVADLPNSDHAGFYELESRSGSYRGTGDIFAFGRHPGQAGASFEIAVNRSSFNAGRLLAFGGEGANGGSVRIAHGGGGIAEEWAFENRGQIDVRGGDSTGALGTGGEGGLARLEPLGGLLNTGDIDARGGDGDIIGGDGGEIRLGVGRQGDVVNTGIVRADGGNAITGGAGRGGEIEIETKGGSVRSSGRLLARGGDASEAGGQAGGSIVVSTAPEDGFASRPDSSVPAGPIVISGRVDVSGGDGSFQSGFGGSIEMTVRFPVEGHDFEQLISIRRAAVVSAAGGDGPADAGHAGMIDLDTARDAGFENPAGPIVIESRVDLSGGDAREDGTAATGGNGGIATLRASDVEHARIDVSGGTGTPGGIDGEIVVIEP